MSTNVKKIRLIWKESLGSVGSDGVNFLCSFDEGDTWVSFLNVLEEIRQGASTGKSLPYASYTVIDDDFSEIDFTIPITLNCVPAIDEDHTSITYKANDTEGIPAGTYYFKLASISKEASKSSSTGSIIAPMSSMSKGAKYELTDRADIKLGVKYDDNIKGLALYVGKLVAIEFEGKVSSTTDTVVFDNYSIDGVTFGKIEKGTIIGSSFTDSMDESKSAIVRNEMEIGITADMLNNFYINDSNKGVLVFSDTILQPEDTIKYTLNVIHYRLTFISNMVTKLLKKIDPNSSDAIYLDSTFPVPYKGRIYINSEYITYTSMEFISDVDYPSGYYRLSGITRSASTRTHAVGSDVYVAVLDGGMYGELPKKSISVFRNVTNLDHYFNFEELTDSATTVSDLMSRSLGTIIGAISPYYSEGFLKNSAKFSKSGVIYVNHTFGNSGAIHFYFKLTSLPTEDMYIFGNSEGLKLKICKDNLRLQLENGDETVIRSTDPRLSKVKLNDWTEICIAWEYSVAYDVEKLYFYKNAALEVDVDYSLSESASYYGIGALLTAEESDGIYTFSYTYPFDGVIDDWRVYNKAIGLDEIIDIDTNIQEYGFEKCGTITIDDRFVNSLDSSRLLDYWIDSRSSLENMQPYIIPYFSILEKDLNEVDNNSSYGIRCDLWPLYAIENGNYFTADSIDEMYPENTTDYCYKIKLSNGKTVLRLNSATDVSSVKYRFELKGDPYGSETPIVKEFSAIVSNSTIDF